MEPIPCPSVILEELARLLNLWAEHNWEETTNETLIAWAENSVARTPRPPAPSLGLHLMERLNLLHRCSSYTVAPSDTLVGAFESAALLDRFSPSVAQLVFSALCTCSEFAEPLSAALGHVHFSPTNLTADWTAMTRHERENVAWEWLQQLGLAEHDGRKVSIDGYLAAYVVDFPIARRRISQHELDERLAARRQRSELAEAHVLQHEVARLSATGAQEYLDGVIRISTHDVEAGYDIHSYEADGRPRKIEVKSSVGPRRMFMLSNNEYETAKENGDCYWIAWVSFAERLPQGPCPITWFRNPVAILNHPNSPWKVSANGIRVEIVEDDSRLASPV